MRLFKLLIGNADIDNIEKLTDFFSEKTDFTLHKKVLYRKLAYVQADIENQNCEFNFYQTERCYTHWWNSFMCLSPANIIMFKGCCCLQKATNICRAKKTGNH